jgi:signal transduction histidine kinase
MSMTRAKTSRSLLFGTAALVVLLSILASLQYRWLGQISEADQARMRAGDATRAGRFARDFDREITRAFLWLQVDAAALRSRDFSAFAERYRGWAQGSGHPALVKDVYVAEGVGETLLRFDAATGSFASAEWPAGLLPLRERLREAERAAESLPNGPRPGGSHRGPFDVVDAEASALVAPLLEIQGSKAREREPTGLAFFERGVRARLAGATIIQLDLHAIRAQVLPDLARRHFGLDDEADYRLVVERREDPKEVVFRSDSEASSEGGGDAAAGLFELRLEDATPEDLAGLPTPAGAAGGVRGPEMHRFGFFRRGGGPGGPPRGPEGHWRLVVTHRAGSVDQLVAAARRRNLAVSAGILALLAASGVLIVVSAQRARRLADRQLEFVAGVSHELRTPVAVICSAGENLADGVVEDRDTVRQYGRVVRDEGRRLAEMVEQVLDFAGTYSGRRNYRFEDVDVAALVEESLGALGQAAREAAVEVETRVEPGLPALRADRGALRRALVNLLQNAVKFGGEGRWVGLRAESGAAGRREVRITVEDRGIGIPLSEQRRLFEPFFRGEEALSRQIRGSGLGLSLVKRIVDAHGGAMVVATSPGRGSAFTLVLPAAPAPLEAPEPTHGTPHTAG